MNCFWLLSFYPSSCKDDGYNTTDYLGVDPRFGEPGGSRGVKRDAVAGTSYLHRFYDFQPGLNMANPAVRAKVKKVINF